MNKHSENVAMATAIAQYVAQATGSYTFNHELDKLIEEFDLISTSPTVIPIWRENKNIPLPKKGYDSDACCDIYANKLDFTEDSRGDGLVIVHTGLHVALPPHYELLIRPRSNLVKYTWYIPNTPGVVDAGYRGEILVCFRDTNDYDLANNHWKFPYKEGERIAQLCIKRVEEIEWKEVDLFIELGESDRGVKGYGSTGKQ